MKIFSSKTDEELITLLCEGGIAVLRTDTLYGLVARADNEAAVERLYAVKGRDEHKPYIVLLADSPDAYDALPLELARRWPGPVSIITPSPSAPHWVRRGGSTVAYRVPGNNELRQLITKTGPLVAPSANPQGAEPAHTAQQAIQYFGDTVDAYVDEGEVPVGTAPSEIWRIDGNSWQRIR